MDEASCSEEDDPVVSEVSKASRAAVNEINITLLLAV